MKRLPAIVALLIGVCLVAWAGYGGYVYFRNPLPRFSLPVPPPPPPDNAYEQFVQCAREVRSAEELARLEKLPDYGSLAQKQAVVLANRDLLNRVHQLVHLPAQANHLEYRLGDPTVDGYWAIGRLIAAEVKLLEQRRQYRQALHASIDGLVFFEKILQGGTFLHLTYNITGINTICDVMPSSIPYLDIQSLQEGVKRMEHLLANEYPLHSLLAQDLHTSLIGWQRTVRGLAQRGFRLDFPRSSLEKEMLFMPKAPITQAALQYAEQWLSQVKKPFVQIQVVDYPQPLRNLPPGLVLREPADIFAQIARYLHVRARLRLLYIALQLELYRRTHGRYPSGLESLGASPYFVDPFSGKPFVYRAARSRYVLYSVGPNGVDDGGVPLSPHADPRKRAGDILLVVP